MPRLSGADDAEPGPPEEASPLVTPPAAEPPPSAAAPPPSSAGALSMPPPTTPQSARVDLLATVAIVALVIAIPLTRWAMRRLGPHPTAEQCIALVDRYAEHIERAVDPQASADAIAARKVRARATATASVESCARELSLDEIGCALRSPNADELERCLP